MAGYLSVMRVYCAETYDMLDQRYYVTFALSSKIRLSVTSHDFVAFTVSLKLASF